VSTCISSRGEFGSHNIPVGESFCEDCGYLDEDAVMAERDALRAAVARVRVLCDEMERKCWMGHEYEQAHPDATPSLLLPVRDIRAALDAS
jgi:hypothetical protein